MPQATVYKGNAGFKNQLNYLEYEYDFDNDGGAVGTYNLGSVDAKMLVKKAVVFVETACTSGGAAVVTAGPSAADPDGFLAAGNGAVGSLVDDYVNEESASNNLVVPAGETIDLVIGTAALTAGKIKVLMEYVLVD